MKTNKRINIVENLTEEPLLGENTTTADMAAFDMPMGAKNLETFDPYKNVMKNTKPKTTAIQEKRDIIKEKYNSIKEWKRDCEVYSGGTVLFQEGYDKTYSFDSMGRKIGIFNKENNVGIISNLKKQAVKESKVVVKTEVKKKEFSQDEILNRINEVYKISKKEPIQKKKEPLKEDKFSFLNDKFIVKQHTLLESTKSAQFEFLIDTNAQGKKLIKVDKVKFIKFVKENYDVKSFTENKIFNYKKFINSRPIGTVKHILESFLKKKV